MEDEKIDQALSVITTEDEEKLDDEEAKIEMFISLIRKFREAREDRIKELHELESMNNKKKKRKVTLDHKEEKCSAAGWVPTFESEDFSTSVNYKMCGVGKNCNGVDHSKEEDEEGGVGVGVGLDLRLAL